MSPAEAGTAENCGSCCHSHRAEMNRTDDSPPNAGTAPVHAASKAEAAPEAQVYIL